MQTNKERLIAALQEPLESTFADYKTSALGLVDDQVEENRDIYFSYFLDGPCSDCE